MRVLHFYKTAFPDSVGGVEQVIDQLARGARAYGVESEVLSLTDGQPGTVLCQAYPVHRVKQDFHLASTGFALGAFKRFAELSREVDLVHYHFPWPFMDMVHFLMRPKVPTLVSYHSDVVRQRHLLRLYRPVKHRFLASASHIVAASPDYLASSEVLQRYRDKVSVIPYGLDRSTYQDPDPHLCESWRSRFGDRFFLFLGVLRYYKGLQFLIEAARKVDYPIVIAGAGPEELSLRSQALGLDNVHFLGRVSELEKASLLSACYGFVFPSHLRSEAFGISLLEGAMFGKPLVSCEIGTGTSFINRHGETGLVVPPEDAHALAGAMRGLWENTERAATMGIAAKLRYESHFTAQKMVASYVGLYRTLSRHG